MNQLSVDFPTVPQTLVTIGSLLLRKENLYMVINLHHNYLLGIVNLETGWLYSPPFKESELKSVVEDGKFILMGDCAITVRQLLPEKK